MGQEHLVVPVVALVEGVIWAVNAETPELVLAEELAIAPAGWNGRPSFVDHPSDEESNKVSGNNPETLESKSFGILFNADPSERVLADKRLRFEAWLNVEKATDVDGAQDIIARLEANDPEDVVEVSVGVFVRAEDSKGKFDGQPYEGIWRNIVPDHLAFLPKGIKGACSVEMGCGAPRVASVHLVTAQGLTRIGDETMTVPATTPPAPPKDKRTLRERLIDLIPSMKFRVGAGESGTMSDQDLRYSIDTALRAVEPGYWGIDSVFPEESLVVYSCMPTDVYQMFQRGYTVNADGTVALKDDRVEVVPTTIYQPLTATAAHTQPPTVAAQPSCGCGNHGGDSMNKTERIAALIAGSKGRFTDADTTWLNGVPEDRLTALEAQSASPQGQLIPGAPTGPNVPPNPQPPNPQPQNPNPQPPNPASEPAQNTTAQNTTAQPRDAESYLATLPPDVADSVRQGMKIATQRKAASIKALKDTQRCKLTDVELTAMTQTQLDTLIELAGITTQPQAVDFSVQAPRMAAVNGDEVPAAPDFFAAARAAHQAPNRDDA